MSDPSLAGKPIPFNPFGDESTTKRSQRQEKSIERRTGGKRQPRSGADPLQPGDVKAQLVNRDRMLIEAKTTQAKSHALTRKRLMKISDEAMRVGRRPAYWITFENMPVPYDSDWVVLPAALLGWEAA